MPKKTGGMNYMSTYDDYLTHDDKPYAENINDALLLSNVFDLTVPIELPTMYRDGTFNSSENPRKASVALVTIVNATEFNITDTSITNGASQSKNLVMKYYPNFNSYGSITNLSWTSTSNSITANIVAANGDPILTGHTGGAISGATRDLYELQEFTITINIPAGASITKINFIMANKDETRYGAECGISDVTGLQTSLDSKSNTGHTHTVSNITDLVYDDTLSSTSTNALQNKTVKNALDGKSNTGHTHDDRYYTETEINTKLNLNGKSNVVDLIYPVGSIYISTISTSPATLFGRGTWQEIQGRFLLGRDNSHPAGNTGGASTVTLSTSQIPNHSHAHSHTHSITDNGRQVVNSSKGLTLGDGMRKAEVVSSGGFYYPHRADNATMGLLSDTKGASNSNTSGTGGGGSHENMPPYIAVYMWERTA